MFTVSDLRTEYATNPLGLDVPRPCFSWVLSSDLRQTVQRAYRVRVASSRELLAAGDADLWDSGKVTSSRSVCVEYAGRSLRTGQRCFWAVSVWDNHGRTAASDESACFEMGILDVADWKAQWIGCGGGETGRALLFRKKFELVRPIVRARAYATGLGYYELRLNGQKVGDSVLEPAWTAYGRRVLYTTYDVTDLLRTGQNMLGAIVGHGWYGIRKLMVQVNIEYADGSRECVSTGWGWQVAASPIVSDGVYDGEVYDARLERRGWDTAEAIDPAGRARSDRWSQAMLAEGPGGRLVAASLEPIRVVATRRPIRVQQVRPGVWVADFGQNFAGWVRIRPQGPQGTQVRLRFAESLRDDGTANQDNLRSARSEDLYILKGEAGEQWEPRFTYHGFRYVQVEGWPGELRLDDLDGRVVRSDVAVRGAFECDHPLVNQIQQAVVHTEASNLHGVPTDCPQRDERLGWLNDLTARAEEGIYNFDMVRFHRKWLADIADAQDENGAIPDTVPYRFCHRPADPVCICYLLLPWLIYQHYGDIRLLREHYAGMKAWVDCLRSHSKNHLVSYGYWGDWAPPIYRRGLAEPPCDTPVNRDTPTELVSTAFYAYASRLLSQIAGTLGNLADQEAYAVQADDIAAAFNLRFWNPQRGGYGTSNQSCNTLALYLGLAPADRLRSVADALVHDVTVIQGGHLATGNICTKYLPEVLTDAGHVEVAFALATKATYPSWGYMLAHGATTIWERWEQAIGDGMNSHNHPMLGSISAWFYRALGGLRIDPAGSGCSRIVIQPSMVSGIRRASASLSTVAGVVRVAWRRRDRSVTLEVAIPANSQAVVCVPRISGEGRLRVRLDDQVIWTEGGADRSTPGVIGCTEHDDHVKVTIGSGKYTFTSESVPAARTPAIKAGEGGELCHANIP